MPSKLKQTILRLNEEQRIKMKYISEQNYRSLNDEFKLMIDKHIADYESQHGKIELPPQGGGNAD